MNAKREAYNIVADLIWARAKARGRQPLTTLPLECALANIAVAMRTAAQVENGPGVDELASPAVEPAAAETPAPAPEHEKHDDFCTWWLGLDCDCQRKEPEHL